MSETLANHFGISTDLSLLLRLHTPLSISAAALSFKTMLHQLSSCKCKILEMRFLNSDWNKTLIPFLVSR